MTSTWSSASSIPRSTRISGLSALWSDVRRLRRPPKIGSRRVLWCLLAAYCALDLNNSRLAVPAGIPLSAFSVAWLTI